MHTPSRKERRRQAALNDSIPPEESAKESQLSSAQTGNSALLSKTTVYKKTMHRPPTSLGTPQNRVFHISLCIKKHILHLCIWGALIHLLATRLKYKNFLEYVVLRTLPRVSMRLFFDWYHRYFII